MATDLSPEGARWLFEALAETDLLSVECEYCGKAIRDHSNAEIKECLTHLETVADAGGGTQR